MGPVRLSGMAAPSFAVLASLMIAGGALSIASIFGFLRRKKGQENEGTDPRERETVPIADSQMVDLDRPTVAATPEALKGKKPSFGVKVAGESIPGASIMPPPHNPNTRGGRGIE